jgi:hypothetical protein
MTILCQAYELIGSEVSEIAKSQLDDHIHRALAPVNGDEVRGLWSHFDHLIILFLRPSLHHYAFPNVRYNRVEFRLKSNFTPMSGSISLSHHYEWRWSGRRILPSDLFDGRFVTNRILSLDSSKRERWTVLKLNSSRPLRYLRHHAFLATANGVLPLLLDSYFIHPIKYLLRPSS